MKEVLGDAATPELLAAWKEAYKTLSEIFISREREIYESGESGLFRVEESRNP